MGAPPTGVTGILVPAGVGGSVAASSGDLGAPLGNGSTVGGRWDELCPDDTTAVTPGIPL